MWIGVEFIVSWYLWSERSFCEIASRISSGRRLNSFSKKVCTLKSYQFVFNFSWNILFKFAIFDMFQLICKNDWNNLKFIFFFRKVEFNFICQLKQFFIENYTTKLSHLSKMENWKFSSDSLPQFSDLMITLLPITRLSTDRSFSFTRWFNMWGSENSAIEIKILIRSTSVVNKMNTKHSQLAMAIFSSLLYNNKSMSPAAQKNSFLSLFNLYSQLLQQILQQSHVAYVQLSLADSNRISDSKDILWSWESRDLTFFANFFSLCLFSLCTTALTTAGDDHTTDHLNSNLMSQ